MLTQIMYGFIILVIAGLSFGVFYFWPQIKAFFEKKSGDGGDDPGPPIPVTPIEAGVDVDKQLEKIQIANGGKTTLWVAYLGNVPPEIRTGGEGGGWPVYPSDYKGTKKVRTGSVGGRIRVDPGGYVYFPIGGKHVSGCRIWAMLGCDDNGDFCKVGGSAGDPGLDGCGYDNGAGQGFDYTVPINSKFEFTFADETNPDPKWPLDSFNVSAVDGLDLGFTYSYYDASKSAIHEVVCGMPEEKCPSDETLHLDCKIDGSCSGGKTANLRYENKDGKYMGCKSPCAYLVKGGYNAKPEYQGKDISFPGAAFYCCPTDSGCCIDNPNPGSCSKQCQYVDSPSCNKGPVVGTKWCKEVHKLCKITKSPNPDDIGKAGIYCQAYDDATGLSNIPAGPNKFKMVFTDKGFEWVV